MKLEKIVSEAKKILLAGIATAGLNFACESAKADYRVERFLTKYTSERKCFKDNRHFLTLLDQGGIFAMRGHPGAEINGWAETRHIQPTLHGAEPKNTIIESAEAKEDGIYVTARGKVSKGKNETYGNWLAVMNFNYDEKNKKSYGEGTYEIKLDNTLTDNTGDLSLVWINSNFLNDVPLLSGGIGDTGDMKEVRYSGKSWRNFDEIWNHLNMPAHYPQDITNWLIIEMIGNLNEVDTLKQGYSRIEPAYKPSIKLKIESLEGNPHMIFYGVYDYYYAQDFWADNICAGALILRSTQQTYFKFNLYFESSALPEDGIDLNYDKKVDYNDVKTFAETWLDEAYLTEDGNKTYLTEDANKDRIVNFYDFAEFANGWKKN